MSEKERKNVSASSSRKVKIRKIISIKRNVIFTIL
jgi:hypothetical protein